MQRGIIFGCIFGLVLTATGCSGDAPAPKPVPSDTISSPAPSGTPTEGGELPTEAPAPAVVPGSVGVDVEFLSGSVHVEVAPIQVKDGVALLSVDYSVGEGALPDPMLVIGQLLKSPTGPAGAGEIRLVDVASSEVLLVGRDEEFQPVATRDGLVLTFGGEVYAESVHSDAFFAAPSGDSVDVLFPYFGLVRDVPVEHASGDLATSPVELGHSGTITYEKAPIDAFVEAFDDSSSSRVTGQDVTVSLASDVLFAVDEFTLTAKARKVVDRAAKEILKAAGSGEVSVLGHTDDVADDAYNLTLSKKRAKSVVAQLSKTLGSDFELTAEGRGESEPAVEGRSAEARAVNRRVEIRFQAKTAGGTVDLGDVKVPAPKANGPVAVGSEPVVVTMEENKFSVAATSVRRAGSYLVGEFRVEAVSVTRPTQIRGLFGTAGQGSATERGLPNLQLLGSPHNLTLLGESSRFYPSDYLRTLVEGPQRALLADQYILAQLDQGQALTVTTMWPDPGGDTVTIDVPDRFRITDVPIME